MAENRTRGLGSKSSWKHGIKTVSTVNKQILCHFQSLF